MGESIIAGLIEEGLIRGRDNLGGGLLDRDNWREAY